MTGILAWALAAIVALALCVAALFYRQIAFKLEDARQNLARSRKDADQLRQEFARVAGWAPDGRLPANWTDVVRDKLSAESNQAAETVSGKVTPISLARDQLVEIAAPAILEPRSPDDAARAHERIISVLTTLSREGNPALPALANGDLNQLFCHSHRLEAYFPNAPQTAPYMFAAAAVIQELRSEGIVVQAPKPLSAMRIQDAEIVRQGQDSLRQNPAIRQKVSEMSGLFGSPAQTHGLVVDCVSPGWTSETGGKRPRIIIWDRSWQD